MATPVLPSRASATPQPQPAAVHLRIGTLSLPGATPAQAARIGDALRRELGALLAASANGLGESRHQARVDGGSLTLSPTDRPEAIGRRLAGAIARSLRAPGDAP